MLANRGKQHSVFIAYLASRPSLLVALHALTLRQTGEPRSTVSLGIQKLWYSLQIIALPRPRISPFLQTCQGHKEILLCPQPNQWLHIPSSSAKQSVSHLQHFPD